MSNLKPIKGENLKGKTVQLKQEYFGKNYKAEENRFTCSEGFGCSPNLSGTAVFGKFSDGEKCRIERYDIQYIVEG